MQWQPECRKTFYWRWWQARLHGNLLGITSPNEHYNTAPVFQNKYTISQCYSYCGSVNVLNTHQKIIPSSRDCWRKGQKNERQGNGLGHTYAYVYKVIGTTGLCLITSFIHDAGKGETRRCQEDHRSWDKTATKGAGRIEREVKPRRDSEAREERPWMKRFSQNQRLGVKKPNPLHVV